MSSVAVMSENTRICFGVSCRCIHAVCMHSPHQPVSSRTSLRPATLRGGSPAAVARRTISCAIFCSSIGCMRHTWKIICTAQPHSWHLNRPLSLVKSARFGQRYRRFVLQKSMRTTGADGKTRDLDELLYVPLQLQGGRAAGHFRTHVQQCGAALHTVLHVVAVTFQRCEDGRDNCRRQSTNS